MERKNGWKSRLVEREELCAISTNNCKSSQITACLRIVRRYIQGGVASNALKRLCLFGHPFALYLHEDETWPTMRFHNSVWLLQALIVLDLSASRILAQSVGSTEPNAARELSVGHVGVVSPADVEVPLVASQFTLGAADVIRINVWKNADLSQTVTVGPDGFVSLPLLGDVHVAGMTANEVAHILAGQLNNFVVSAQVTVSVVEFRSRQVYVMGRVGRPGGYPLIAPITVLQLIAQAGGLNAFANSKGIFVLRGAAGDMHRLSFNYVKAIHGDNKQNVSLLPGDTVIVP